MTPLDEALHRMQDAPDDTDARLAFYERLAGCELFLMLAAEAGEHSDAITPEIFELQDASYVLVFDREERLAAFAGQVTPFVALSGRAIVEMLAGQSGDDHRNIGLGINLDSGPSALLLPPSAVAWLHETLGHAPSQTEERIAEIFAPAGLPERLIEALDAKLATALGLAVAAYLVGVRYDSGARGHLLAFAGAIPQAEGALAQAAAEALTFSGIEAGAMDVTFFAVSDPVVARMERVGLRFDLPQLQETVTQERPAPGSDPAKPPRLK